MHSFKFTPAKLYDAGGDISKRWYAYFSVRDPGTGKLKLHKKKAGINRGDTPAERRRLGARVVAKLNELLEKGWTGNDETKRNVLPLKESLDELLAIKKATLRRRTWQSYKYSLDIFFAWMKLAEVSYIFPQQFTSKMCHSFTDYLQSKRKFKGKAFNSNKNHVSIFFNMLLEREVISSNPFSKIKNQKEEIGRNIAFTADQKKKLTKHLVENNHQLYLFTQFIYFCYIRPLELLRIRVSNIDLKHRHITIDGSQSKNKKTEIVVIPNAFMPMIKAMKLKNVPGDYFLFGKSLQPGPEPYSRNTVTMYHSKALKELKFPDDITMYSWKHTGVVAAYKAGVDLYSIMRQCRHSSINQTQTYLKSLGLQANTEFANKMK